MKRRFQMCLRRNGRNQVQKMRNLVQLGVPKWKAYEWGEIHARVTGEYKKVQYYIEP